MKILKLNMDSKKERAFSVMIEIPSKELEGLGMDLVRNIHLDQRIQEDERNTTEVEDVTECKPQIKDYN